jgi:hypothetical protein
MRTPRQYKVQGSRRSEVADADAGQSWHRSACALALATGTVVVYGSRQAESTAASAL